MDVTDVDGTAPAGLVGTGHLLEARDAAGGLVAYAVLDYYGWQLMGPSGQPRKVGGAVMRRWAPAGRVDSPGGAAGRAATARALARAVAGRGVPRGPPAHGGRATTGGDVRRRLARFPRRARGRAWPGAGSAQPNHPPTV